MAASFDFIKRLGSGYFGEVWLAVDTGLNYECALKCIPPDKLINKDNFYQEAQILKAAEHPNIIKVTETGELGDKRIYVVMEYLRYGSLEDEASGGYVHLSRAKRLMVDVLRGLEHAHSKNIIHRDIKPANILIGNAREGKLSDFGLALKDVSKLDLSSIKQYQYMLHLAPEVKTFEDYTKVSDIYACGMTLYRLVNGDSFLPAISPKEASILAIAGKFPDRTKYRDFITKQMKSLINKSLSVSPGERFKSAEEMRHALEQVTICVDWEEKKTSTGMEWSCKKGSTYLRLNKDKNKDGTWNITFAKGKDKNNLRRDNTNCENSISSKAAAASTQKILQGYVGGRM